MNIKLIIIIVLVIAIAGMATFLAVASNKSTTSTTPNLPIYQAGEAPAFNEPLMSPVPSPTPAKAAPVTPTKAPVATSNGTGAILVAPPQAEIDASQELFDLLARGTIKQPTFTIEPNQKERKLYITVNPPSATNIQNVVDWLDASGYGDIHASNITYIESD